MWKPHVEVFIKTKDTEMYNKPGLFRRGFDLPLYMYLNYLFFAASVRSVNKAQCTSQASTKQVEWVKALVKQVVRVKKNHSVQNVLRAKTSSKQVVRVKTSVKQVERVKDSIKQTISLLIRPLIEIVYTYLIRYNFQILKKKKPPNLYFKYNILFFIIITVIWKVICFHSE